MVAALLTSSFTASSAAVAVCDRIARRSAYLTIGLFAICGVSLLFAGGCYQEPIPHVEGIEVRLTEKNFDQEVLQSEIPVLVDFGASWCGPCLDMDPIVALLSEDYEGLMKVGKIDVDESPHLARQFQVEGLPTFVLFRDGDVVERNVGTHQYAEMRQWLDRAVGVPDFPAM